LLYVGITGSPPQRFRAHSKTKEWWHRISDVKLVHFEDRAALIDAERDAIKSEHPLHNIVHNKKLQQNETPSQREERRWHHLIGQLEELQSRTDAGCAAVWHHVNRGEYEAARERLDALLSEMAWFGSAAAEELIAASYHSGGSGPCTCGKQVLYFRTSDRYIHSDGTDSCFQPRWLP
jgi:predicted GIY-YIG superfamily endonuclease